MKALTNKKSASRDSKAATKNTAAKVPLVCTGALTAKRSILSNSRTEYQRLPPAVQTESYNETVNAHVISNPVPTPEEMGKILGLSSDRVAAVRRIMSTPSQLKKSTRSDMAFGAAARKKSSRTRVSPRTTSKK